VTKSLLIYSGNDPQYLAIVWHLARLGREGGDEVVLLDLSGILRGVGDAYNRPWLRASRRPAPDALFREIETRDGFRVLDAGQIAKTLPDSDPPAAVAEAIAEAVHSALVSYARDPLPPTKHSRGTWTRLQKTLAETSRTTFQVVAQLLERDPEIGTVYVVNGRFPHQRAAIEAARLAGRTIAFYEKGDKPNSFWLEDHSTLDREATQSNVDRVLGGLSRDAAAQVGIDWMNGRARPGNAANIYSRFFSDPEQLSTESTAGRKMVGLFTSSQDEFAALGPEWHVQDWRDQWEAFDHVLSHLDSTEHDFYLRVHPNFTTKSHASFLRERENVLELARKHPSLSVIWHDEQVNSYALVGQTDVVVVWDSTIGLEASGRGVPVWELAASYYDLYADVHQWFGPEQDPAPEDLHYVVDVERAHRFMGYLVLRDTELPQDALDVRDRLTPDAGFMVKVASIAAAGGAPNASIAVSSILDAARHRRFAINRMAARSLVDSARK
jgi:hypothetical protein